MVVALIAALLLVMLIGAIRSWIAVATGRSRASRLVNILVATFFTGVLAVVAYIAWVLTHWRSGVPGATPPKGDQSRSDNGAACPIPEHHAGASGADPDGRH